MWGCLAYCKNNDPKRTKLGLRGIKCAFISYASNSKGYRLLNLESKVIIESRDVELFEYLLTLDNKVQSSSSEITLGEISRQVGEQLSSQKVDKQPSKQGEAL